jgi:hypothetical protein
VEGYAACLAAAVELELPRFEHDLVLRVTRKR